MSDAQPARAPITRDQCHNVIDALLDKSERLRFVWNNDLTTDERLHLLASTHILARSKETRDAPPAVHAELARRLRDTAAEWYQRGNGESGNAYVDPCACMLEAADILDPPQFAPADRPPTEAEMAAENRAWGKELRDEVPATGAAFRRTTGPTRAEAEPGVTMSTRPVPEYLKARPAAGPSIEELQRRVRSAVNDLNTILTFARNYGIATLVRIEGGITEDEFERVRSIGVVGWELREPSADGKPEAAG